MFKLKLFRKRGTQAPAYEYKIFTKEFDLEVTGHQLSERITASQANAWREENEAYDALCRDIKERYDFDHLSRLDLAGPWARLDPNDATVSLLLDHSGSLKGRPAMISCLLTELIADYLTGLGVRYEILGFTTSKWLGGRSRIKWLGADCPKHPGRLNDLLHIVYREATDTNPGAPPHVRNILNKVLLKENIDGEALLWAADRLRKAGGRNRIILLISDGVPADDATLIENGNSYLLQHLQETIAKISRETGFSLAGIGVRHDLSSLFANSLRVDELEDAPVRLQDFLRRTVTQVALASRSERT